MATSMRISRLISSSALAVLMLAAGAPAWAQEEVPDAAPIEVAPPVETPGEAPPEPTEPTGPLIDDAGPLPDVGEATDLAEEEAEIVLPTEPFTPAPVDDQGRSVYGLFLAGRSAMVGGQNQIGADYLAAGHLAAPQQSRIKDQAFTAAVLAGDLDFAARIAPETGAAVAVEAGRLVEAVRDLARGRAGEANALLAAQPIAFPHARAGLLVQPWVAAAAGDWARALAPPPAGADAIGTAFARYHRAILLETRRNHAEAEAQFTELMASPPTANLFRLPYGEFLERRGRRDEAVALYDAATTRDPGIAEARDRAVQGTRHRAGETDWPWAATPSAR